MRSPTQMIVACIFELASKQEVDAFANMVVNGDKEYNNTIFETLSNDVKKARHKLERYLRSEYPDFQLRSDSGVDACKSELILQIERLLDNQCTQEEFRNFFVEMESQLMLYDHFWGDLYNKCDCFDENWNFLENDYLIEEAQRVLEDLSARKSVSSDQLI